jgi:hypothetical protein
VHGERRRGRARSRILYWFRTPPGVRVGRAALDPEAIRLIEERHPDIAFDWPRILKGEGADRGEGARPDRAERPRPPRGERPRPPRDERLRSDPRLDARPGPSAAEPVPEAPLGEPAAATEAAGRGGTAADIPPPMPAEHAPDTPAGRRLGAEGLARLRARYSEVLARIEEKAPEAAQQTELKSQAERLNPDAWVTDEEVGAGLEQYEAVYESLRAVVGRRRARRNRERSV